jgi:hypothetical protein
LRSCCPSGLPCCSPVARRSRSRGSPVSVPRTAAEAPAAGHLPSSARAPRAPAAQGLASPCSGSTPSRPVSVRWMPTAPREESAPLCPTAASARRCPPGPVSRRVPEYVGANARRIQRGTEVTALPSARTAFRTFAPLTRADGPQPCCADLEGTARGLWRGSRWPRNGCAEPAVDSRPLESRPPPLPSRLRRRLDGHARSSALNASGRPSRAAFSGTVTHTAA